MSNLLFFRLSTTFGVFDPAFLGGVTERSIPYTLGFGYLSVSPSLRLSVCLSGLDTIVPVVARAFHGKQSTPSAGRVGRLYLLPSGGRRVEGWLGACMYVCMYACMYVRLLGTSAHVANLNWQSYAAPSAVPPTFE